MRLLRGIFRKIDQIFALRRRVDEELFDELEEALIQADVSVRTTTKLVDDLREAARRERFSDSGQVRERLADALTYLLGAETTSELATGEPPTVYLVVGVNGVGKTTTIAKLAHRLKQSGKRVILAAGDTFRAAAIEQLEIWAGRVGVEIIKHQPGADSAAVVFDAIQAAKARKADFVIADTAGRVHTRANLMEELRKIGRVVEREIGRPADEVILVLDATTGQNAVSQASVFLEAVKVTAIALAKLDGTAKGGIVITIKDELGIPIKLVGVGEKLEDLEDFSAQDFVASLFADTAQ